MAEDGNPFPDTTAAKWALGLVGTWIVLTVMDDLGAGDLAAALAATIAISASFVMLPGDLEQLNLIKEHK